MRDKHSEDGVITKIIIQYNNNNNSIFYREGADLISSGRLFPTTEKPFKSGLKQNGKLSLYLFKTLFLLFQFSIVFPAVHGDSPLTEIYHQYCQKALFCCCVVLNGCNQNAGLSISQVNNVTNYLKLTNDLKPLTVMI